MRLIHHHFDLTGPSVHSQVCKPSFAVRYINDRLNDFAFYKEVVTTPVKNTKEIRSLIKLSAHTYIILRGAPEEVMPVLSWLNGAKEAYLEFISSQESK